MSPLLYRSAPRLMTSRRVLNTTASIAPRSSAAAGGSAGTGASLSFWTWERAGAASAAAVRRTTYQRRVCRMVCPFACLPPRRPTGRRGRFRRVDGEAQGILTGGARVGKGGDGLFPALARKRGNGG